MRVMLVVALAVSGLLGEAAAARGGEPAGSDLLRVLANAHRGEELRFVALGGSITQAGQGWIGEWLDQTFPRSRVSVINAGMSATGSGLGVFRIERDVIAHRPHLVAIEFCVNDGGLPDEDAVRFVETLVLRLKQLPDPPAIVMLEAAAKSGVDLRRHRQVARHYGLLAVDLQRAAGAALADGDRPWSTYFDDDVHPNAAGHALYARTIAEALRPFVSAARDADAGPPAKLPPPLSKKPLLLDARMVPLTASPGWRHEPSLPFWWNRFFDGVITADEPGATLRLPVRGTAAGLFYAMDGSYGSFYASVNGAQPSYVSTRFRAGFDHALLALDLPAQEHVLTVVLPPRPPSEGVAPAPRPVNLGYLLVAGETHATPRASTEGPYSIDALRRLVFVPVPPHAWKYSGPHPVADATGGTGQSAIAASSDRPPVAGIPWQAVPEQADEWTDLLKRTPVNGPAVAYVTTPIEAPQDQDVLLSLEVDYYAKVWINDQLLATFDGNHGHPRAPVLRPARLRKGSNSILIMLGSGSGGLGYRVSLSKAPPGSWK